MTLRRQDVPPDKAGHLWIRRLGAEERITITILSATLWGCWTHWNGRSSEQCDEDEKKCHGHRRGYPLRWKGYLHVYNHKENCQEFIELPPGAARCLLATVDESTNLRGQRCDIKRMKGRKTRLEISWRQAAADRDALPKEKSPHETLKALWGVETVKVFQEAAQSSIPMNEAV